MTDHTQLKMHHEDRRIADRKAIEAILEMGKSATVAIHDEPFPYLVPMNYGYAWEDGRLVLFLHMFTSGHKLDLLRADPRVAVNVHVFLDRIGYAQVHHQDQDYRSVTVFGTAEIVPPEDAERYLHGFSVLMKTNNRPDVTEISPYMRNCALLLRVPADVVTAKAQYPVASAEEVPMPENTPKE